jgi:isocitrate lyase
MEKNEQQIILEEFRDYVIQQARTNLTKLKKNSSRKLYDSIKGEIKAMPNSLRLYFDMADYGFYQDKGVSGTKKKYDTPFSYTNKMPPPKAFDKWIVKKGIAPRNKEGKFQTRKGLQFAIARSIFEKGIKPSLFFTKPFEKAFKNLPNEMIEAYGLEAEETFDTIMKENFKK